MLSKTDKDRLRADEEGNVRTLAARLEAKNERGKRIMRWLAMAIEEKSAALPSVLPRRAAGPSTTIVQSNPFTKVAASYRSGGLCVKAADAPGLALMLWPPGITFADLVQGWILRLLLSLHHQTT